MADLLPTRLADSHRGHGHGAGTGFPSGSELQKCAARSSSALLAGAGLHLQGGRRKSKRAPLTLIAQSVSDATFNTRARLRAEMEYSKAVSGMAIPALDSDCQIQ